MPLKEVLDWADFACDSDGELINSLQGGVLDPEMELDMEPVEVKKEMEPLVEPAKVATIFTVTKKKPFLEGLDSEDETAIYTVDSLPSGHVRNPKGRPKTGKFHKTKPKNETCHTVHVGNLDHDVDHHILLEYFRVKCDGDTIRATVCGKKGFGYVDLRSKLGFMLAMKQNGKKLSGRPMKVSKRN